MAFESLSFKYNFELDDFPERWLPLIHLYDPDLPSFPVYYFHAVPDDLGHRPNYTERVFGFIEKLNILDAGKVDIHIVVNKNLDHSSNSLYKILAEREVKERLGISDPVTLTDINNCFSSPYNSANQILQEIWHRVVANVYDNKLPFGRLWDEVIGLSRFVASWYSDKGRKGELIQTHYFCSKFGEKIQMGGGINNLDFYLLPTIQELVDGSNPLNLFPAYKDLFDASETFRASNCSLINVGTLQLLKFNRPTSVPKLNTAFIQYVFGGFPTSQRTAAIECFNSFNKGPQRTVIFLMMLNDLRNGRIKPKLISSSDLGSIYDSMAKSYQSPKVIHIYAQQSFGHINAVPIDIWIETFLEYPLNVAKLLPKKINRFQTLFSHTSKFGKVERLLWIAAQARKVHSSACNDALWCIKKASNGNARGANPFACKTCILKPTCPSYADIKTREVLFNAPYTGNQFVITTSEGNNTTPNQTFISCRGQSLYGEILDDFTPYDVPTGFTSFPNSSISSTPITVENFINSY
jgi:hypothetical protein